MHKKQTRFGVCNYFLFLACAKCGLIRSHHYLIVQLCYVQTYAHYLHYSWCGSMDVLYWVAVAREVPVCLLGIAKAPLSKAPTPKLLPRLHSTVAAHSS